MSDGPVHPRPRPSPRARLLLALLSSSFALAAVEGAFRLRYGRIERITGAVEWRPDRWGGLTYHWDQYDPLLGWTNRPGYRSDASVPFRVTINGQGLRAPGDYPAAPAPGVRRIALFGDSCAFGEEVDDDQTVAAHLERLLGDTEVLNFGVRGYGLGQMALRLEREGLAFRPDRAVVLILLPSDLSRDSVPHFSHPKPVFGVEEGRLTISNVPVPEASRQPWHLRRLFTAAWLLGRPREARAVREVEDHLRIAAALLQRIGERCAAASVPVTVATLVVPGTIARLRPAGQDRRLLARLVSSLAREADDFLDLTPDLERALARRGRALVAPNGHWSGPGNELLARRLAAHLALPRAPS